MIFGSVKDNVGSIRGKNILNIIEDFGTAMTFYSMAAFVVARGLFPLQRVLMDLTLTFLISAVIMIGAALGGVIYRKYVIH